MTRGEFDRLVQRYRVGKCTPEEIALLEQWMEVNGDDYDDESTVFENEAEAARLEEKAWTKIYSNVGLEKKKWGWLSNKWLLRSIAASFLLIVSSSLLFLDYDFQTDSDPVLTGLETINTSTNRQRIVLPDSSIVTLAEGASLSTSESYGDQFRKVRLKGEAFFEIRPDPKVPFLVYSGDLVAEVLGTSFAIKPEASSKTIEVSVTTGKVSVYSNGKDRNQRKKGVIITPNQKAVYDMESKLIHQDLVETPQMIDNDIPKSTFDFDDTPVKTVLEILRSSYGMEIVVSNPDLNNCLFSGNLIGFDLFKQLDYICKIVGSRYEVRGTTIFVTGDGCRSAL